MQKIFSLCLLFVLLFSLTACAGAAPEKDNTPDQSAVSVTKTADPQKAITEIYKDNKTLGLQQANDDDLRDKFFIDTDLLEDFYCTFSDGRFGVADVFILKPDADKEPQVRESLEKVKLSRAREFENYDIRNAYSIAQEATIFEQNGYVIMLMLDDVEAARKIIDEYIPKNQ